MMAAETVTVPTSKPLEHDLQQSSNTQLIHPISPKNDDDQNSLSLIPPTAISNTYSSRSSHGSRTPRSPQSPSKDILEDKLIQKAFDEYQRQNYAECKRITSNILQIHPNHGEATALYKHLMNKMYDIDDIEAKIHQMFDAKINLKREHLFGKQPRSILHPKSIIDRIDNALELYYSFFPNATYKNNNNEHKFKAFCSEQFENNDEAIREEMNENVDDCALVLFDEDEKEINHFPLEIPVDPEQRHNAIFNIIKYCYNFGKPPQPILKFINDDYGHVLGELQPPTLIHMKPKSTFIRSTKKGFKLNQKKDEEDGIKLNIRSQLTELIGISQHKRNNLFHKDFASLLIDSYYRYCIMTEIIDDNVHEEKQNINRHEGSTFIDNMLVEIHSNYDVEDSFINYLKQYIYDEEYDTDSIMQDIDGFYDLMANDSNVLSQIKIIKQQIYDEKQTCFQSEVYGQVYWKNIGKNIGKKKSVIGKYISNIPFLLKEMYENKVKEQEYVVILFVNGIFVDAHYRQKIVDDVHAMQDLFRLAMEDYMNIIFRFMSSNRFYWSLAKYKELKFFEAAFDNYKTEICRPLTLQNIKTMDDNIFVFWLYIWSMSKVVKSYMDSGDIKIPLQVDLVIIPNNYTNHDNLVDIAFDNISERFNIHDLKFEICSCDPTDIDSIEQNLDTVFKKCANKMKQKEHRIIIIVDRRSRDEYFTNKYSDRIFGYKPPTKYAQIDKKHEIISAIWNTSKFVIPPPPSYHYEEHCGTKHNNFFVLSYFVRKKSQFFDLFNHDDTEIKQSDDDEKTISTVMSFQSEKHIAFPTLATSGPKQFVKQNEMSVVSKLTIAKLSDLYEKIKSMTNAQQNLFENQEYQALQNYINEIIWYRKHDAVVNMYIFYNKGYCRFEPLDLLRILPKFFNLTKINKYNKMLMDFTMYHDKLWELEDDIWMKYQKIYLKSTAMEQRINVQELGTDDRDRAKIKEYCSWNKQRRIGSDAQSNNEMKIDGIDIIQNGKYEKVVGLNIKLDAFIAWRCKHDGQGMIVTKINNNDYKKYIDIKKHLWSITHINDINVSKMRESEIKELLIKIDESNEYTKIKLIGGLFRILEKTESNQNKKVIAFSIELNKFLRLKHIKEYGIKIIDIFNNDYGITFRETGVVNGWYINNVKGHDVTKMDLSEFKSLVEGIWNSQEINVIQFIYPIMGIIPSQARRRTMSQHV